MEECDHDWGEAIMEFVWGGAVAADLVSWEPFWWACPCVWFGQRASRGSRRRRCSYGSDPSGPWWSDRAGWTWSGSRRSWNLKEGGGEGSGRLQLFSQSTNPIKKTNKGSIWSSLRWKKVKNLGLYLKWYLQAAKLKAVNVNLTGINRIQQK